ncbi:hypothetical protein CCACVL1_25412 [Corchorus capsularis]|uniref:Transposase, Ptta/En/Spm, plant n=1 Tax=Corchorus capsularis TaxID=210143 RepID=A0A1R3GKU8_COCAP|nr:hypothetical protein CCACVL1_25412 [Corchorus capsularis]
MRKCALNGYKKEMYPKMVELWEGDRFKRPSEANKKNREAGLSTVYKGGSARMGSPKMVIQQRFWMPSASQEPVTREENNLLQEELQNLRNAIMEYGISIPRRDQPTSTQGSQNMENVQHPETAVEQVDEHAGQSNTMQNLDSPASQHEMV